MRVFCGFSVDFRDLMILGALFNIERLAHSEKHRLGGCCEAIILIKSPRGPPEAV